MLKTWVRRTRGAQVERRGRTFASLRVLFDWCVILTFILLIGFAAYAQEKSSCCEFGTLQVIKVIPARSLRKHIKRRNEEMKRYHHRRLLYSIDLFINYSNLNRVERPPKKCLQEEEATSIVNMVYIISHVLFWQELERNIALCSQKLLRAEKLISGLGGERSRWTQVSINTTWSCSNRDLRVCIWMSKFEIKP